MRRRLLRLAVGLVAGLALPWRALAVARNRPAFDARVLDEALAAAGVADAEPTDALLLRAPDIAENSALVHVEIESRLPRTEVLWLFAERNPQPLVAQFDLLPGMEPFLAVRIKMNESAHLRVVARAGGRHYFVRRETKVTLGGCAG